METLRLGLWWAFVFTVGFVVGSWIGTKLGVMLAYALPLGKVFRQNDERTCADDQPYTTMQNENTPAEGRNSDKLEAESALRDAACSPSSSFRQRVVVRIETIDAESGKIIAAENHPYEFDCMPLPASASDETEVSP
jgi:hypothetical protein